MFALNLDAAIDLPTAFALSETTDAVPYVKLGAGFLHYGDPTDDDFPTFPDEKPPATTSQAPA